MTKKNGNFYDQNKLEYVSFGHFFFITQQIKGLFLHKNIDAIILTFINSNLSAFNLKV